MMEHKRLILILGAVLALVCPSSELPKTNLRQQAAESAIITDEIPGENHPEEDDYYQEFLGVPMPSSTDDFGVKGRPGIDFPNLAAIPVTSFTCQNVKESGYFADMETKCQVFHICDGGRKMSFLCPNGTIFRQSHLICDWWFRVDCENSQDYYDPITDTLAREKDRAKHDRMPSESRESMSITTEFKVPPNENHNLQAEGPRFLEATQPLHSSTQRATTVVPYDREYVTSRTTKQRTRQQSQPIQKAESATQEKQIYKQDPEQYRQRADFRSKTEYLPRESQAKAEEDHSSRDSKEWEYIVRPSSYSEEGPVLEISLSHDQHDGNQNADLDFRGGKNEEILSADRRIDTIPKKEKDCIHDENEGQVLAETASFAGSHRRGRLESITFSQVTDGIPSAKVSVKGKSIEKPLNNEDVVTYRPPREEDADSVVTYRPVMDLEKLLHQRREQLTKDDDDEESSHGKPYTGPRTPPNIPLSSGPGAVHSLALYIATGGGGDNLLYNTYRQTEGNTKGTTSADLTKKVQDRTSTSSIETNPSVTESVESLTQKEEGGIKEAVTQSPIIITASNQPIFNLEDSDVFRTSGSNQQRNIPANKEVQYVLVRGRKIVNSRRKSNSIRYLPTEEFSTRSSEKLVTEKTPTKNTEPPSLDINLVTTFLPKDANIPSSDISFKSLRKDSELVNIRSPIISTLTKKENFQEIKPNKTSHSSESKGKEILGSSYYSTDPLEYAITQRSTTSNEAEENSFSEKEQYFRLEKFQPTTKEYGTISSKHFQSKTEVNHKKSDSSARKMKDYLLGNYTSDDSGLFQHINKALSKTNATNMTEEKMNMFYKETVEQTLKEAIAKESLSEVDLSETSSTTEESPNSTEETVTIEKLDETTTMALPDAIEITPFFRLENGKITSTPSKFPKDEDLSTTPSDLRELAQVFSRALSAYLEDPETFREALASVSHPPNPTIPSGILYDSGENLTNSSLLDEEDDEVLDFSDVQIPTTIEPSKTETTTSKANSGFYITIPLTTPAYKSSKKSTDTNHFNSQDAEGPDYKSFSTTESIQEVITSSQNLNSSISLSEQLKTEESSSTAINPNLSKEEWSSMHKQSKIKTTEIPEILHETKSNKTTNEEVSFTIQLPNKPLTENLPPLEIDLLPPFQDPIPNDDDLETDRDTDSFTEINIPTAALDEILNEFVPEELNRLAMTSIEPDVIPDTKIDYLSSYTGTSAPEFLNTNSFQSEDSTTTPTSTITSTTLPVTTTPVPQITQTISNDGQRILTRLTARLPQGTNDRNQNSVSYTTYTNQLLKIITNPTTEKDESLVHAQSASFLPSQSNPNKLLTQGTDKFVEQTSAVEKITTTTESPHIEKTTQVLDYEFINIPKTKTPSNDAETISTTEAEIITEMKEDRSYSGNPRLVLLFVNDRSAKGRGINEKNARLLRALLRKDDHQILRSAGLIPDVIPSKEVISTTDYNPYTIASITPRSTTTIKSTTNSVRSEVRTEPPITTYAPKFTMTWEPLTKAQSTFNESPRVEKSVTTESTKAKAEETTPISYEASLPPSSLPEKLVSVPDDTTSILGTDDKSTVSDGRAFDLLRSLYSLTARWG